MSTDERMIKINARYLANSLIALVETLKIENRCTEKEPWESFKREFLNEAWGDLLKEETTIFETAEVLLQVIKNYYKR